ncbi:hypothetical protein GIB67_015595 [Kingdonia uniflora]|uniref:JmjC domain-containing protein n=1 Tax=Kingdonia uniflora TaxID=39325 RepID=A0A7J7LUB0_9MAGN|nr:hypothetical protein GIB67_015595 [Kingdonia uniflora]
MMYLLVAISKKLKLRERERVCSSKVVNGGAVWDIFRREDVPKLMEYLDKHQNEFRDRNNLPVNAVSHPIHDQTLFLNERHKKQLKEEFADNILFSAHVEPWTFVQYLGQAVFIPAGCPHQVRNKQSCIKVALDFVSPENVQEFVRLTEEFHLLPKNHRAKEDKLEVNDSSRRQFSCTRSQNSKNGGKQGLRLSHFLAQAHKCRGEHLRLRHFLAQVRRSRCE